jgi:hypothetical protein
LPSKERARWFLAGTEGVIDDDDIRLLFLHDAVDFFRLALADVQARVRRGTRRRDGGNRSRTRGADKFGEFLEVFPVSTGGKVHMDQYGPLTTFRAFEQTATRAARWSWLQALPGSLPPLLSEPESDPMIRTLRAGTTVEIACL